MNRAQLLELQQLDIVGDIHGCFDELLSLVGLLGYEISHDEGIILGHPQGRKLVLAGDLVDRGPKVPEVLNLAMHGQQASRVFSVVGNHDDKLLRALKGKELDLRHGLRESLEQIDTHPENFRVEALTFLESLPSYLVFDAGQLIVSHAGIDEEFIGQDSEKIRQICMYGKTTGEVDEYGLCVRYPWAEDYKGEAMVVYGHTPNSNPAMLNNTINIDTGCVFGGRLTAFRYPEKEMISVPAHKFYFSPPKPF